MSAVSPTPETGPVPAAPAPSAPSVARRVLARVSAVERSLVHDPLVKKDGKALVAALVLRGLVVAGASDGSVQLVRAILHSLGA